MTMFLALTAFLPLVASVACVLFRSRPGYARTIALVGSLATLAAGTLLAIEVTSADAAHLSWQPFDAVEGAPLALFADGLSVAFVLLTAVLGVVAVLISSPAVDEMPAFFSLLLALESAVMTVFLAGDLVLFYVAWEAVLIPMFFLIGRFGHENRRHAATKFFIYTFAASAPMLVGIISAIVATGTSALGPEVAAAPAASQTLVFWLLAIGMLVKLPVWPLHTWLPDAHVEAPTAGSIMLAGVLLKMGGYGLLRVALPIAPEAFAAAVPMLGAVGIVGIVYGGLVALGQQDLKRLIAYSSIAHMGFVVLGIASSSAEGLHGAVLAMVSHGLVAGMLFLLVGSLYERTHTRDLGELGGLSGVLPRWTGALVFGALASLGLPGLSGFPGEFLVVLGGFASFAWWMLPVALGMLLAAAYNLKAVRQSAFGPADDRWSGLSDLGVREMLALAPLVLGIVALGVMPGPVQDLVDPVLAPLVTLIGGGS
jgi:NADH-quinone oxidoreductase subunit M